MKNFVLGHTPQLNGNSIKIESNYGNYDPPIASTFLGNTIEDYTQVDYGGYIAAFQGLSRSGILLMGENKYEVERKGSTPHDYIYRRTPRSETVNNHHVRWGGSEYSTEIAKLNPGSLVFTITRSNVSHQTVENNGQSTTLFIGTFTFVNETDPETGTVIRKKVVYKRIDGLDNVRFNPETATRTDGISGGTLVDYESTATGKLAATEHQLWEVWNELTTKITALEARVAALENQNP